MKEERAKIAFWEMEQKGEATSKEAQSQSRKDEHEERKERPKLRNGMEECTRRIWKVIGAPIRRKEGKELNTSVRRISGSERKREGKRNGDRLADKKAKERKRQEGKDRTEHKTRIRESDISTV